MFNEEILVSSRESDTLKESYCFPKLSTLSYRHNIGEEPLKYITLGQLLENTVQKYPDRAAIISKEQNKTLTFKEALEQADKLAAGLIELGIDKGSRLGLWAPNLIEFYVTLLACARAGIILVALNPLYQKNEIEYCINQVGMKGIICPEKNKTQVYYEILKSIAPSLSDSQPGKLNNCSTPSLETVITISDQHLRGTFNYNDLIQGCDKDIVQKLKENYYDVQPHEPSSILFSSGTTGKPKAAVLNHFSQVNNGYFLGKRNGLHLKEHRICTMVPLFHACGMTVTISGCLNHGSTIVLPWSTYSPDRSLTAIQKDRCTVIYGTPTMYVDLINKQLERNENIAPEIAVTGGAPCSPHLLNQITQILKVKTVKSIYGLTEATAVVFQSLPNEPIDQAVHTVGYILEHVEAKVVDLKDRVVPLGTPGELCLRGYMTMLGYWGDEENTKKTLTNDGWLKTGDKFILEKDGYGKIVGRFKDMIIRGGENIFPKEIEDVLNTHLDIIESMVIGLPHERLGEEVCACVRYKKESNITLEDIQTFCFDKLSRYNIPTQLRLVDSFPKTTSGKIQKFKLVEQFSHTQNKK